MQFWRPALLAPKLSADVRAQLSAPVPDDEQRRTLFDVVKCVHCGGLHDFACPRVKRLRFRPLPGGGTALVEVEFWPEGQWPHDAIIWPSDVYEGSRTYEQDEPEPEPEEQPPVAGLVSSTS